MRKWIRLALFVSFSLLVWKGGAEARERSVTLYSITHLQSQLLPLKVGEKKVGTFLGGLAQAAGLVLQDRERYANSIFFTAGESFAGTQWRHFRGEPEMEALAEAGIAVNTLGKHEFDYGVDCLKAALSRGDLPFVISNIVTRDAALRNRLRRHLVLEAGGLRVGFFGLLSPAVMRTTAEPEGVSFEADLKAVAREMVEELRRQGADLIVLLSGLYESENVEVAQSVAGIHVITGCGIPEKEQRDLYFVTGPDGGETAVTWSGERAQFVGRLQVFLRDDGKLDRKRTNWKLLPVTERAFPHFRVMETATEYDERLTRILGTVIGRSERIIDARKKTLRSGEAPIGNFIADSIRWKASADVAVFNGGGIRSDRIHPAGDVSERTLAELLPFGDRLCCLTVTGRDLKWVLEVSASALVGANDEYDPDVRLHSGSFLHVSGLKVLYDLTAPPTLMRNGRVDVLGSRLKSLSVLKEGVWREVRDDEFYSVALSSWMAQGGGGGKYSVLRNVPRRELDCLDIEAFKEYFQQVGRGRAAMQRDGRIEMVGR